MTKKSNYLIYGHVVDHATHQGMPGVRVEAWDHDMVYDDLLESAVTDDCGVFRLEIAKSAFESMYIDKQPHLFFKVFQGDKLVESTEHSTLWQIVKPGKTEFTIDVEGA